MTLFRPSYSQSFAIVVGVNKYQYAPPLLYAVSDAEEISSALVARFGFVAENVVRLTDEMATRQRITSEFARLAKRDVCDEDDRVIFFFAGHGHTVSSRRGDTGFLVPVDGNLDDLSTLVRWDELARSSDLVSAKHLFFIIDACYGGLALSRKGLGVGSVRLLKDMLQRYSRQVLTAGKADEPVSDGGGTRKNHSLFTSYVLDSFDEICASGDGIVTANKLMSMVYEKVGADPASNQTPHYGFVDGDGDFIFNPPKLDESEAEGKDIFLQSVATDAGNLKEGDVAQTLKNLLSEPSKRIELEDYIDGLIRRATKELSLEKFPAQGIPNQIFPDRVAEYEKVMTPLSVASILMARWAKGDQLNTLYKILRMIAETDRPNQGITTFIHLSWYPYFYLLYAAGISAISQERYDVLYACLMLQADIRSHYTRSGSGEGFVLDAVVHDMTSIVNSFKMLPGYDRHITARSDYLYQRLQHTVEDTIFLGKSYQSAFDNFEIMLALCYADMTSDDEFSHVWGPPGRFLWQNRSEGEHASYRRLMSRASTKGQNWEPLKAGFFRGSADRFKGLASNYLKSLNSAPLY